MQAHKVQEFTHLLCTLHCLSTSGLYELFFYPTPSVETESKFAAATAAASERKEKVLVLDPC